MLKANGFADEVLHLRLRWRSNPTIAPLSHTNDPILSEASGEDLTELCGQEAEGSSASGQAVKRRKQQRGLVHLMVRVSQRQKPVMSLTLNL
jgi:hypothetical protein